MLRQKVIREWSNLREIIRNNQQYWWGQLLTRLGIRSLAPHLDIDLVVAEITNTDKRTSDEEKAIQLLREEKQNWQKSVKILKDQVNKPIALVSNDRRNFELMRGRFNDLKTLIQIIDDDERGPTIEEVD